MSDDNSNKKKGKQATKGDAQIVKENAQTIEFYKKILIIVNILFTLSTAIAWYVWWFMRQVGTKKSTGSVTDLNLEGSISEYAKDIILAIVITQFASLLHRYCWWLLLVIPLYAIYKAIMLFFFSSYAQLGASDKKHDDDDQADGKRGGKRKLVRVARH
ncbi:unnamed protein product [Rotaria magnacalcarata]|uniref:Transmembrane protein 208 n=1 Tax=Rotaria magnacalcarata TaxID=392030 RepID=A0A819EBK8_9BILA|nr:unnamed protein product [Rotaria magnacalcarata]CAF3847623.1 unnamed protein product [Rotaria magnacalcarata]CAF4145413.1 unnamed protein product [Rotaria magnacalcarata]